MSLAYSDTTNKDGIIQRIEQELGFTDGFISGDSTRLKLWTGSINLALDRAFHIIFGADGKWQFDDSNHTKDPVIYTDLSANQRKYTFTTDEQSNLILDIAKVMARQSSTSPYQTLTPIDSQSEDNDSNLTDGLNASGFPTSYDKTGNSITLDYAPTSTVTLGLKLYINREGSYFLTSDTTKTPGFHGLYHEYLVLEPCYRYARAHGLASQETLKRDVLELEKQITKAYSRRARDEKQVMKGKKVLYI